MALGALLALAGCPGDDGGGGGGTADDTTTGDPNLFCPADPEPFVCGPQGMWSDFLDWSDVPPTLPIAEGSTTNFQNGVLGIHAMLLHTNQLLVWQGRLDERAYDLDDGTWTWHPLTAAAGPACGVPDTGSGDLDLFCSGHSALADGSVVVGGGNVTGNSQTVLTCAYHFDPATASPVDPEPFDPYDPFAEPPPEPPPTSWDSDGVGPMDEGRWYPTYVTLASGDILAASGSPLTNEPPEVLFGGQWVSLPSANQTFDTNLYAFLFVLPDGNVFYAGARSPPTMPNAQGTFWISRPTCWTARGATADTRARSLAVPR